MPHPETKKLVIVNPRQASLPQRESEPTTGPIESLTLMGVKTQHVVFKLAATHVNGCGGGMSV